MKTNQKFEKKFYIATSGILAEECARKFAKRLRKHKIKIRTAAIPTSRLGNAVFFRNYWIEVELTDGPGRIKELLLLLMIGSFLTGEYSGVCDIYGYRAEEFGDSMEECWRKVYTNYKNKIYKKQ